MAGFVMGKAADGVVARGRAIAAHMLKVEAGKVDFADGQLSTPEVYGTLDRLRAAESDGPAGNTELSIASVIGTTNAAAAVRSAVVPGFPR